MSYDITFTHDNAEFGRETIFRIYNAASLREAVERFEKANPGTTVIRAEVVTA